MEQPLIIFSLLLIGFYSAEMVWKERSIHMNYIIDATPVKNSLLVLSKLVALVALPLLLISTGLVLAVVFQSIQGHFNFEWKLYASVYYYQGMQLRVFCCLALCVHTRSKTKFMGIGIFLILVGLILKSDLIGLEHPLTSLAFLPSVSYSNMYGFYGGVLEYHHLSLYWSTFGLLLVLISLKLWNRGILSTLTDTFKILCSDWNLKQASVGLGVLLLFFGAGARVFYHTNILTDYDTHNDGWLLGSL